MIKFVFISLGFAIAAFTCSIFYSCCPFLSTFVFVSKWLFFFCVNVFLAKYQSRSCFNCQGFFYFYSAICVNPCAHGSCVGPDTCSCDAGWEGALCDSGIHASLCLKLMVAFLVNFDFS